MTTEDRPSLGKVYDAINGVREDIVVMKDQLLDPDDHERRIRSLESRMWAAVGVFGLIAAASPYLSRLIPSN